MELSTEALGDFRVPVLPWDEQRRIADFLDDQVTRIDDAVGARQQQVTLLDERRRSEMDQRLNGLSGGLVPLRRLVADVCVGIVIQPAALYVDDTAPGVPAMRGTDVREGWVDTSAPVRIARAGHHANPRSVLTRGDVVVVRTGAAGTAAVIGGETEGWNCIDLVIVRTDRTLLPRFLEVVMNHYASQARIGAASAGSIQSHFGVGAIRELLIPSASVDDQARLVDEVLRVRRLVADARVMMREQMALLEERKRALITAAVTGGFDVSTASARAAAAATG